MFYSVIGSWAGVGIDRPVSNLPRSPGIFLGVLESERESKSMTSVFHAKNILL